MTQRVKDATSWWLKCFGACVVAFLLISLGFAAAGLWAKYVEHLANNAPAWIQAVGSVLAIVGAFQIMNAQAEQQRERDAEEARRQRQKRLEVCAAIITRAGAAHESCLKAANEAGIPIKPAEDEVDLALEAFDQMPLIEVPDPYLINRLVVLRQMLFHSRAKLRLLESENGFTARTFLQLSLARASAEFDTASRFCVQLLAACSTPEEMAQRQGSFDAYRALASELDDPTLLSALAKYGRSQRQT